MIEIDNDVQGVANALNHIDHHICLRFSEAGGYFVAYWKPKGAEDGEGYLITTSQDLDHRLVKKVEGIYEKCKQPGYSFAKELEKAEAKAKADEEYRQSEEQGETLEKLAQAMRKDLGYEKKRITVPEAVK